MKIYLLFFENLYIAKNSYNEAKSIIHCSSQKVFMKNYFENKIDIKLKVK